MKHLIVIFVSLLIGRLEYSGIDALQCYVCENCVEGTKLEFMQTCGEQSGASTSRPTTTIRPVTIPANLTESGNSTTATTTTRRTTTTTTRRTTTTVDDFEDSENYSEYEDSDEADDRRKSNLKTIGASTARPVATINAVVTNNDDDDSYYDDDTDARRHKPKHPIKSSRQSEHVCFVIKYHVNNTEFTNFGCASMVNNNNILTCQTLNPSGATVIEDCQLCNTDGCNKFYPLENGDYDAWEDSAGKNAQLSICCIILIFIIALVF